MEIIEIGGNSFCLRTRASAVPSRESGIRNFAEKALSERGFSLSENAEITAYSNGLYSLLFVCEKNSAKLGSLYSFFS